MSTFRRHFSKKFFDLLIEDIKSSNYYAYCGHPLPWEDDFNPPQTNDSEFVSYYDQKNNLIFGKKVTEDDLNYVVPKYEWTYNEIYSMYDDRDANLFSKKFFVINQTYDVYKCLYSPGTPSTQEPNSIEKFTSIKLSDGYIWKYLYTLTELEYNRFASSEYIPVRIDQTVKNNATPGTIDAILIKNDGVNYATYNQGNIQRIVNNTKKIFKIESSLLTDDTVNNFYKDNTLFVTKRDNEIVHSKITKSYANNFGTFVETENSLDFQMPVEYEITPTISIEGDGSGFVGKLVVNTGTRKLSFVDVIDPGSNYNFANVSIVTNPSYGTSGELQAVISPQNGHGYDAITELGSNKFSITVDFEEDEFDEIPTNVSFRSAGILANPVLNNSEDLYVNGTFSQVSRATYTKDDLDKNIRKNDRLLGSTNNVIARVISANNTHIEYIADRNEFANNDKFTVERNGLTGTVTNLLRTKDLTKEGGDILFTQQFEPVTRTETSTEQFKLIFTI